MEESQTINDLRQLAHARLLASRNLWTVVVGEKFTAAYAAADPTERRQLWDMLQRGDIISISQLVRRLSHNSLTIRDLRKVAADLGVKNYWFLTKAGLLSAIHQREIRNESGDRLVDRDAVSSAPIQGICEATAEVT